MARLTERDHFLIGGRRTAPRGDGTLEVISPSTEQPVGRVPLATGADMDAAVAAARTAFDEGPWPRLGLEERARILLAAHDALLPRADEISELVTAEMGLPLTLSKVFTARALGVIPTFVDVARTIAFEEQRPGALADALVVREPVGVVAGDRAVERAAAQRGRQARAGRCCWAARSSTSRRPRRRSTRTSSSRRCRRPGVPDGAVNLVPGGREAGEHLVRHPGVDKVAFTGSAAAGRRVGAICGEQLKPVTLELGGKSAAIVLDDADSSQAAIPSANRRVRQQRTELRRLQPRARAALPLRRGRRPARRARGRPGRRRPVRPETNLGPLVAERQRDARRGVHRAPAASRARGSSPAAAARPDLDRGWYVEPTVFADVESGQRIAQEEIFGPVVAVSRTTTEDDAVRIANDSEYGLHGGVFTTRRPALDVARRVRTGTFTVNGYMVNFDAPFGGMRARPRPRVLRRGPAELHGAEDRELPARRKLGGCCPRETDVVTPRHFSSRHPK